MLLGYTICILDWKSKQWPQGSALPAAPAEAALPLYTKNI